jgi:SpoVK/Ycf46/Vps4 family AAA+-type ATPase
MNINLITKLDSDKTASEKISIQISSNSITAIESYINNYVTNLSNNISNKIPIYRINVKKTSEKRIVDWNCSIVKLSKNVTNTIVTDSVKKSFYDDVYNFINNEQFYLDRGLPYKRGYILHGQPGCGKTSLIKAIANQYKLPIFIVDLNLVNDNGEFIKLMNDINSHVVDDQKYLVVFEDIDRTSLISDKWGRDNITMDCFLNVLDGLDEYYGRITVLTANDISRMRENTALVRAGRIDVIAEIPMCSHTQILSIIQFYFKDFDPSTVTLNKNIIITPSQLTQLIFTLNDENKIITAINKHVNFAKVNLETMNAICYENVANNIDDDNHDKIIKCTNEKSFIKEDGNKNRHQKSFARRIKSMTDNLTIYDMKIKRRLEIIDKISEPDRLEYEKWLLEKRLIEIRLSKTSSAYDIYEHKLAMRKN